MRPPLSARPRPSDGDADAPEPRSDHLVGRASPALVAFGAAAAIVVLAFLGS